MNYKISRIAENNVEVIYTKEMTDINGIVFKVMAEDEPESFGIQGVENQLADIEKQIQSWNDFDEKAYKKAMQDKVQERKQILLDVQNKMKE